MGSAVACGAHPNDVGVAAPSGDSMTRTARHLRLRASQNGPVESAYLFMLCPSKVMSSENHRFFDNENPMLVKRGTRSIPHARQPSRDYLAELRPDLARSSS